MLCWRRQRSTPASHTRASIIPNHPGDVPHVCACGPKRPDMPLKRLPHPVCCQLPCASSGSLTRPEIVSRDRKLRPGRLLCVRVAGLGQWTGTVAEKLTDSILTRWSTRVDGPLDVDLWLARQTFNVWSNVDMWPCAAHGSCIGIRAACPVGTDVIGERAGLW